VTRDGYCSPSVNDLDDVCKKNQIDHNLKKLWQFLTFQKNEDQTKQSLRKLGAIKYLNLSCFIILKEKM